MLTHGAAQLVCRGIWRPAHVISMPEAVNLAVSTRAACTQHADFQRQARIPALTLP